MDASTALVHGTLLIHLLSWFNNRYTSGENDSKRCSVANTWVEVLKMGGTKSAEELAKAAGVDVSTDAPLKDTIATIGGLIDEIVDITKQLNA